MDLLDIFLNWGTGMDTPQDYNVGDQVRHKWHGDGSVVKAEPEIGGIVYLVRFRDGEHHAYGETLKLVRRATLAPAASAGVVTKAEPR